MPYRRRKYRRRPIIRRKRLIRRRFVRRRPSRIFNFKQCAELNNFTIAAGSGFSSAAYNFRLTDIPNSPTLNSLFDQYRIMGVRITFYPNYNIAYGLSSGTSAGPIGELYTAIDYDLPPTVPFTEAVMNQYTTLKRTYFNRPHTRFIKPSCLSVSVWNGTAAANTMLINRKTWMDMANLDSTYYGLLVGFANSSATATVAQLVRVTATYYIQCKNVR